MSAAAVAALGLSVMISGCGGPAGPAVYPVTGTVTYGGQPVTEGEVSFASSSGEAASASLGADGKFTLKSQHGSGMPEGTYKVAILPPPADPSKYDPAAGKPPERPDPKNIPARYRDPATSKFEATVKAEGSNDFKFEMEEAK